MKGLYLILLSFLFGCNLPDMQTGKEVSYYFDQPAQNAFAFSDRVSGLRNRDVCGSSLCPPDPLCRTPCSMRLHHGRDLLFGAQAPHGIR